MSSVWQQFQVSRFRSTYRLNLFSFVYPGSPAAMNGDVIGRYLGYNTASDEHFATIREWIKECQAHPKCNQTVSGSVNIDAQHLLLPTRCIEVSRNGRNVRLRETVGLYGSYITLTHRWNPQTETCKTTTANLRERLAGKGLAQISQLFRDVLTIADKLNVQYVWIDSLCIIQDDGEDWRREAPKMAQYYQLSLFTVAGTMLDTGNGILSSATEDTRPWVSKLVRLPYRDGSGSPRGHFYVYQRRESLMDEYWTSVRGSILFSRGWILQEWLLSKRFLWYTPKGLFFECQSDRPRTDCEEKIPFEVTKSDLRSHLQLKSAFYFGNADILAFWYHTIELYSTCDLTRPDLDRVLALAGVAKETGAILARARNRAASEVELKSEVYMAGLWLRDIHYGLLWEEDHAAKPWTSRVAGISSWSWASLMTPVKWPERGTGTHDALELTGLCLKASARDGHNQPEHAVVGKRILQQPPNSGVRSTAANSYPQLFDPMNMFSCLHIRGKLYTVHVRGYLETEENLYTAAVLTGYAPIPKSCQWRAICSPLRPETIVGWGSLESMDEEGTSCPDSGRAVYALHISTRYVRSGRWIERADPVMDVLFIRPLNDDGRMYTRLGVGRIADRGLMKEFHRVEDQDIQLS